MTYFTLHQGMTLKELKKQFASLAMKLHPDAGGDAASFIAMKSEYDSLETRLASGEVFSANSVNVKINVEPSDDAFRSERRENQSYRTEQKSAPAEDKFQKSRREFDEYAKREKEAEKIRRQKRDETNAKAEKSFKTVGRVNINKGLRAVIGFNLAMLTAFGLFSISFPLAVAYAVFSGLILETMFAVGLGYFISLVATGATSFIPSVDNMLIAVIIVIVLKVINPSKK